MKRIASLVAFTAAVVLLILLLVTPTQTAEAQGVLTWFSVPNISGTGSPVVLSSATTARMCQLVAPSTNTAGIQWGDSAITTTRGATIYPGGGQFLPPGGVGQPYAMNPSATYVLVQSGDTLTATCAK